jgi:hypothetical protein
MNKKKLKKYLNTIREDLLNLCEDNAVMRETIDDYFTGIISEL